jgi:SAM-dependent methyltransferase
MSTGTYDRFAGSDDYLDVVAGIDHEADAESIIRRVASCLGRDSDFDMLEVGVGTGWLLVHSAQRGIRCSGVELNPIYREHAMRTAHEHGVEVEIRLGSVEDVDLGRERYDVVVATSVFEHVRNHRKGLVNVYRALRPGGVFYFYSTNKFSSRSGEYPQVPLYGWLPNRLRFWIRAKRGGRRIIDSARVDFNQFTYWGLRRDFNRIGYSEVLDPLQFTGQAAIHRDTLLKRAIFAHGPAGVNPLQTAVRVFASGTLFLCVK